MKAVISFFCLSILLISCKRDEAAMVPKEIVYAVGMTTNYLTVNNVKRKYLVYRPIGITEINAVVLVLHGGGGLGIGVSDIGAHPLSVFRTIADNEKFLVVYPEGSLDIQGNPG